MEYSEESLKIAKDVLTIFNTFLMNCDSFVKNSFKSSHSINGTMLHQVIISHFSIIIILIILFYFKTHRIIFYLRNLKKQK